VSPLATDLPRYDINCGNNSHQLILRKEAYGKFSRSFFFVYKLTSFNFIAMSFKMAEKNTADVVRESLPKKKLFYI
jgi:hypothetical protein